MEDKLKQLIDKSERVLITSHISPDGDSISSSLLLYKIITENYPGKLVTVSMEEKPFGLEFLSDYDRIVFQTFAESLINSPDLLIVLDANALHRISRQPEQAAAALSQAKPKLAIIDHHEGMDFDDCDVYINNKSPATTLDV